MDDGLLRLISTLMRTAPKPLVHTLVARLTTLNWQEVEHAQQTLLASISQPTVRNLVQQLVVTWQGHVPVVSPQSLAFALLAAAQASQDERSHQEITLVWSGPNVDGPPLRRTDQTLLQVIEQARHTLLIVSFAVYDIPSICQALVAAAARHVHLQVCIESPEESRGRLTYDALRALGPQVASAATVYFWPYHKRERNAQQQYGVLHAKCAVADQSLLFLSSANLTAHALTLNMELGVLVKGGSLPNAVWLHFQRLIEYGILVPTQTAREM